MLTDKLQEIDEKFSCPKLQSFWYKFVNSNLKCVGPIVTEFHFEEAIHKHVWTQYNVSNKIRIITDVTTSSLMSLLSIYQQQIIMDIQYSVM